jgi:hypothetical protein
VWERQCISDQLAHQRIRLAIDSGSSHPQLERTAMQSDYFAAAGTRLNMQQNACLFSLNLQPGRVNKAQRNGS